jgi:hypothetical protein
VAVNIRRYRLDLGALVRQRDLHGRLLLDAVAVHVYGFEDALGGEILLLRRGQRHWLLGVRRILSCTSFYRSLLRSSEQHNRRRLSAAAD